MLEFHSNSAQRDDFTAPVSKVYEMVTDPAGGGRLRMKVGIDKGGKEDKRNLAFHPSNAYVGKKAGSSVNVIFCDNCVSDVEALSQLLQELIKTAAKKHETPATLTSAPVAPGPTNNQAAKVTDAVDRDAVLRELLEIEKRSIELGQKGDRNAIAAMMIDEFTQTLDNKTYNKSQILSMIKPRTIAMTFGYEAVDLNLQGDTAVLEGTVIFRAQNAGAMVTVKQRFKDTFVRRDGKWLAAKSEVTTVK